MTQKYKRNLRAFLAFVLAAAVAFAGPLCSSGALAQPTPEQPSPEQPAPEQPAPEQASRVPNPVAQCRERLNRITDLLRSGKLTVPPGEQPPVPPLCSDTSERAKNDRYAQDFYLLLTAITDYPPFKQRCSNVRVDPLENGTYRIRGTVLSSKGLPELLEQLKSTVKTVKIELDITVSPNCLRKVSSEYVLIEDEKGQAAFLLRSRLKAGQTARLPPPNLCDELGQALLQAAKEEAERSRFRTGFWTKDQDGTVMACTLTGDGWEPRQDYSSTARYAVMLRAENP